MSTTEAVLKQCLTACLSTTVNLGQAIKQDKTILDSVGSPTTYYLHCRRVDSLVTSFFGSFFVENSVAP